jgi:fructokinase
LVIDLVPVAGAGLSFAAKPGGAPGNLAAGVARLGLGAAMLSRVGPGALGQLLVTTLADAGVDVGAVAHAATEPTSLAVVALDDAGKPDYAFHREGVADRVGDAARLIEGTRGFEDVRLACTGCLALLPEDGQRYLPWLRDCRERGLLVAVDANLRPAVASDEAAYRDNVRAALALADVVKVSDDDLALLSSAIADPVAAALRLFELGPVRLVALTRGAEGATLLARDGRRLHAREHEPLRIADTVGAGDCFFAGLLSEIVAHPADMETGTLRDALRRAVASASLCVQQAGCMPPDAAQLTGWLARGSIELA